VIFLGGLDSVVLAAMAASFLQKGQMLELYNVGFGSGVAADRQAGLAWYQELQALYPEAEIKLVLVDINDWESVVNEEKRVQLLISPKTSVMDLNIGTALWFASRGVGLLNGTPFHSGAKILILLVHGRR
jgi:asparagine synthetase B (glutamine-hydrolysing)